MMPSFFSFRDTFLVPPIFYYSHNAHKHPTHYYFCPVFTSCVSFHSRLLLECKYISLDGFIQERGVFRAHLWSLLYTSALLPVFPPMAKCNLGGQSSFSFQCLFPAQEGSPVYPQEKTYSLQRIYQDSWKREGSPWYLQEHTCASLGSQINKREQQGKTQNMQPRRVRQVTRMEVY